MTEALTADDLFGIRTQSLTAAIAVKDQHDFSSPAIAELSAFLEKEATLLHYGLIHEILTDFLISTAPNVPAPKGYTIADSIGYLDPDGHLSEESDQVEQDLRTIADHPRCVVITLADFVWSEISRELRR